MNADKGNFQHIAYAFKTDVGKARKNNEDALGAFPEGGVFCVADGMGGGDDGEIASAAVVKAVDDVAQRCATGGGHSAKDVATALEAGLSEASAWIWKRASNKNMSVCGSTFVGVAFDSTAPAKALALHAGDSRVYLIRGKNAKRITRDHSASEMMGEKDERKVNPMFRSMIVNAVGIRKVVECERTPFKVAEGDRVLICSDGLYRMVTDKQIGEMSSANPDVEKAVDALVAAALAGGGVDNVSVVLCELGKFPKALPPEPVPAADAVSSAVSLASGNDGDSASDDADATRETMIPAFEKHVEEPGKAPEPHAEAEGAHSGEDKKTPKAGGSRRLLMAIALVLSFGMMAAAAIIMLKDRQSGEAKPAPKSLPKPVPAAAKTDKPPARPVANVKTNEPPARPVVTAKTVKPPVQTESNRVEKAVSAPVTNSPAAHIEVKPCAALISACDARSVADFAVALKKLNVPADSMREFDEQMRRFRESAKLCSRMRTEKAVRNVVIDLKYVLPSAEAVKKRLESASADERIGRYFDDWVLVTNGSEKDVRVQEACARMIVNAPQLKIE